MTSYTCSYVSAEDVSRRYRMFDTNSMDTLQENIYYAEKEIESSLATVYTVPFTAPHPTVKDLVIDMTYIRYLRMIDPEKGMKLYDFIRKRLNRIQNGEEPLVTGSGTLQRTIYSSDMPASTTDDYHPIHSLLDAEDNIIDQDLIDDLESEREDDYD